MLITVDYVNPWIAKVRRVTAVVCVERTACDPPAGDGVPTGSLAGALTTGTPGGTVLSTTYRGYD